jgi:hypothetical protein
MLALTPDQPDTPDPNEPTTYYCINEHCQEDINPARAELGYTTCLQCGDRQAIQDRKRWTIAPLDKSNYMLFTDVSLLKQLNPKRTT